MMDSLDARADSEWSSSESVFESPLDLIYPPSQAEGELRDPRAINFMNGRMLVIVIALLTQIIVLAFIAMIMGVAVITMCAVLGELLVITAIATALERQLFTFADLFTMMEVAVTILITAMTVFLAAVSSGSKLAETSIIASRLV